jgi:hypothetical protein
MIAELTGNGRLEYSYQPQVPLVTMLLHLTRSSCSITGMVRE